MPGLSGAESGNSMARNHATSLKDVAQAAGVSIATVSRLLNGTLELPAETKTRIETAIRELNYLPNPHARRLSRGRSDTIGLVVPDIGNPFFGMLVAAVEEEAHRRGLALSLFATLNPTGRELSHLRLLARNHVDGLVFITNHPNTDEWAELINATGKVVADRTTMRPPRQRNRRAYRDRSRLQAQDRRDRQSRPPGGSANDAPCQAHRPQSHQPM